MEGHEGHVMPGHEGHSMSGHEGHMMPGHESNSTGQCIMMMSWNSYTKDICIVTEAWHIRSSQDFVLSLVIILGISVGYEYLKWIVRCLDMAITRLDEANSSMNLRTPSDVDSDQPGTTASFLRPRSKNARRIIPMTYSDLLASNSASDYGDGEMTAGTKNTPKSMPYLLRLLYVLY